MDKIVIKEYKNEPIYTKKIIRTGDDYLEVYYKDNKENWED